MKRKNNTVPTQEEFATLANGHSLIPVFRSIMADLETPVSAFLRMADEAPEAFLLESVEGGEHVGRYTFIGIDPYKKLRARGHTLQVEEGKEKREMEGDIFEELKLALGGHTAARLPGLPPFSGGAVGFFAYDIVRQIERLPEEAEDELRVPDACLMFFDQVMAFDHVKKEILLIATVDPSRGGTYEEAGRRLDRMEELLARPLPEHVRDRKGVEGEMRIVPRTSKPDFLRAVEKTKEYIAAGDIFQCVLSQRFDCEPGVDAFEIYRALRIVNPSPYMFFLRFGLDDSVGHIVGSSPELLVRVHGRGVEYRPIAGTRRRGGSEEEDRELEADLRGDEKEVAEHIMLVDLGRNDVGRVSEYGSVRVKELMFVERYSHVMHLVSAIEGKLRQELDAIDAFKACFPAGTLSGAPKIRAMEIIEEMEPVRRGVYGGSVFYADFSGNLDSCIAIRTMFLKGEKGYVQAGAGIVADSVPEKEFEECGNKARAVFRAIERAREG